LKFSKEQFIEWTTVGYPFQFNETITKEKFFEGLVSFINQNENDFYANSLEEDLINIYEDSFGVIMSVKYEDNRIVLLTVINSDEEVLPDSESFLEKQHVLGDVCLGVITFCQCMEEFFDVVDNTPGALKEEQNYSNPWPLKS
jgi:hypothetical protein